MQMHKCPHCDKVFDRRGKLTEHIRVHSDFKQFVCETCGSAFKSRKMLKHHGRRHGTGDPLKFKCTECGLQLASSFTYKSHLRQHSGERPVIFAHFCSLFSLDCLISIISFCSLSVRFAKKPSSNAPIYCDILMCIEMKNRTAARCARNDLPRAII